MSTCSRTSSNLFISHLIKVIGQRVVNFYYVYRSISQVVSDYSAHAIIRHSMTVVIFITHVVVTNLVHFGHWYFTNPTEQHDAILAEHFALSMFDRYYSSKAMFLDVLAIKTHKMRIVLFTTSALTDFLGGCFRVGNFIITFCVVIGVTAVVF